MRRQLSEEVLNPKESGPLQRIAATERFTNYSSEQQNLARPFQEFSSLLFIFLLNSRFYGWILVEITSQRNDLLFLARNI